MYEDKNQTPETTPEENDGQLKTNDGIDTTKVDQATDEVPYDSGDKA